MAERTSPALTDSGDLAQRVGGLELLVAGLLGEVERQASDLERQGAQLARLTRLGPVRWRTLTGNGGGA